VASSESRMLLKTIRRDRGLYGMGATMGATRMNNPRMIRTELDNRERQTRGHELI
jgi:hypothetical protein